MGPDLPLPRPVACASIIHDTSFLFDPTYIPKDYRLLNLRPVERKEAYRADITYGTNNEFGFDYLRDNMKFTLDEYVQRELNYAIVDEVDNILIDEARTPLIISGPAEESTDKYYIIDRIIPRLTHGRRARTCARTTRRRRGAGRLHGRREVPHRHAHRGGRREVRAPARRHQPLRPEPDRHRCTTSTRR